jgi:hypothetical protein
VPPQDAAQKRINPPKRIYAIIGIIFMTNSFSSQDFSKTSDSEKATVNPGKTKILAGLPKVFFEFNQILKKTSQKRHLNHSDCRN